MWNQEPQASGFIAKFSYKSVDHGKLLAIC